MICFRVLSPFAKRRVTGKQDVVNFSLAALSKTDHFADVSKMIIDIFSCIFTSDFGLFNYGKEIASLYVAEELIQLSSTPTFHTIVVTHDTFKLVEKILDFFCLHNVIFKFI